MARSRQYSSCLSFLNGCADSKPPEDRLELAKTELRNAIALWQSAELTVGDALQTVPSVVENEFEAEDSDSEEEASSNRIAFPTAKRARCS